MRRMLRFCLALAVCVAWPCARAATCPPPANGAALAVPGHPFGLAFSSDGCWLFVAMKAGRYGGALGVLHDTDGTFALARSVGLPHAGNGEALTHDGRLLIVTEGADAEVFDVAALEQGSGQPRVGRLNDGDAPGMVYALASKDDGLLFVSDENAQAVSVFDLAKWRAQDYRGDPLLGRVTTAPGPVGLALAPDGRWLYVTSEVAPRRQGFADTCAPETHRDRRHPQGLLLRIDVAKAAHDPRASLAGGVQAGCNPVRVAVAPDGEALWVTARDSREVLRIGVDAFAAHGGVKVSGFDVGGGPVGIAIRPDGKQAWIALADRFQNTKYNPQGREVVGLLGIDAPGPAAVNAVSEPASAFPRELVFLPDGRSFAVGLYAAQRIEFFTTPP